LGLETLDLAQLHEEALIAQLSPSSSPAARDRIVKQAGVFFAEAILPLEATHQSAVAANVRLRQMNQILNRRTEELAASNRELKKEIARRRVLEADLRRSERHSHQLLEQSRRLQEQLRQLSRQILLAQEEERRKISRELHDVIAQVLTGINVRLAALKTEATFTNKRLTRSLSRTQQLVEKSVDVVHRFARELRPAALDDLGLIPALHSFMKRFTRQTGVHIRFRAFAGAEQLDSARRTVLYRVAQEALNNVGRHAQASQVEVSLQRLPQSVRLCIKDNGKAFVVERVLDARKYQRLGLLGMRERVEMVGGSFSVESAPGKGTTIRAQIPLGNSHRG
jgi:signal transduction histidine kinase